MAAAEPMTVIQDVERWISANGPAGRDPYDHKGHPVFLRLQRARGVAARAARRVLSSLARRYPLAVRRALGVRKAVSAKAMGLLAAAYTDIACTTGHATLLDKARECAEWLLGHPSDGYDNLCWGYPFDWQSVVFIPKGTPSGVVSATVGDGLWLLWRATNDERLLGACRSICEFFIGDLRRDEIDDDTVCFSYTPIDEFHVHNENLLVAEFLARVGSELGIGEYVDIATRAGNYALAEQRPDGSLNYWGSVQDEHAPGHRDCYHTGFEARALWGLWKATADARFRDAALRCLDFFYRAYIRDDGAIWPRPDSQYPVDIHGCAEALLCPAALREAAPSRFERTWPMVLSWVVENMQNPDGSFAYRKYADGRIDRTPYMRWGQAWILRALAALVRATEGERT